MTLSDEFVRFVDPFCAAQLGDFCGWGGVAAAAETERQVRKTNSG